MRVGKYSRSGQRGQRGATLLEFVLSFMIIVFLFLSMFEMIMLMYTYSTLTDAAKEGVRYAIVHGGNSDPSTRSGPDDTTKVEARVREVAGISLHNLAGMTVLVLYPEPNGNSPPSLVTVTITYPYLPYIDLPWAMPTMHASAAGRIVN